MPWQQGFLTKSQLIDGSLWVNNHEKIERENWFIHELKE